MKRCLGLAGCLRWLFLFVLSFSTLAVGQFKSCSICWMTQTSDTSSCALTNKKAYAENMLTGTATYDDTCARSPGFDESWSATSTVTGYGQCALDSGGKEHDCAFDTVVVVKYATSETDYDRLQNWAYDKKQTGSSSGWTCTRSGPSRYDEKLNPPYTCNSSSCGTPDRACCGGVSPTCSGGFWSCNGATSCMLPPSQYVCTGTGGYPDCSCSGWYCNTGSSPIIIDTTGTGFHLTTALAGVRFDISGNNSPQQLGWTAPVSSNGWLALDRNGNGKIDDGKELFGNYTDQPTSTEPNGFLALAVFDTPASGGNGDGVIDQHDAVFDRLRVWIDEDHDGVSRPSELHTLPSQGIYSIAATYSEVKFADPSGNRFRYRGILNPEGDPNGDHVNRVIYDVFLDTVRDKKEPSRKANLDSVLKERL